MAAPGTSPRLMSPTDASRSGRTVTASGVEAPPSVARIRTLVGPGAAATRPDTRKRPWSSARPCATGLQRSARRRTSSTRSARAGAPSPASSIRPPGATTFRDASAERPVAPPALEREDSTEASCRRTARVTREMDTTAAAPPGAERSRGGAGAPGRSRGRGAGRSGGRSGARGGAYTWTCSAPLSRPSSSSLRFQAGSRGDTGGGVSGAGLTPGARGGAGGRFRAAGVSGPGRPSVSFASGSVAMYPSAAHRPGGARLQRSSRRAGGVLLAAVHSSHAANGHHGLHHEAEQAIQRALVDRRHRQVGVHPDLARARGAEADVAGLAVPPQEHPGVEPVTWAERRRLYAEEPVGDRETDVERLAQGLGGDAQPPLGVPD